MTEAINAVVVVRFDENGDLDYHVCGGEAVRLFIVDERCPNDRTYEWLPRCDTAAVRAIIPESEPIGSCRDERHTAIKALVGAVQEGRPHLSIVSDQGASQ